MSDFPLTQPSALRPPSCVLIPVLRPPPSVLILVFCPPSSVLRPPSFFQLLPPPGCRPPIIGAKIFPRYWGQGFPIAIRLPRTFLPPNRHESPLQRALVFQKLSPHRHSLRAILKRLERPYSNSILPGILFMLGRKRPGPLDLGLHHVDQALPGLLRFILVR